MKYQKTIGITGFASIAVLLVAFTVPGFQVLEISAADEAEKAEYQMANDLAIHTVFTWKGGITAESDTFQVFQQTAGTDRDNLTSSPEFKLEGAVDESHIMLYQAADVSYEKGRVSFVEHEYTEFDADVYIIKDGMKIRQFAYTDCDIKEYKVDTKFDKEEGWTIAKGKGFAIIDEFKIECAGMTPSSPMYEMMTSNGYEKSTTSTLELDEVDTWITHPKFQSEAFGN